MQGAVDYSQLPRSTRTPASASDKESKPLPAAATSSKSSGTSAKQQPNAQQQQQQNHQQPQQYLRVGSPAEGTLVDALQFGAGSASAWRDTSMPLTEVVMNDDGGG